MANVTKKGLLSNFRTIVQCKLVIFCEIAELGISEKPLLKSGSPISWILMSEMKFK